MAMWKTEIVEMHVFARDQVVHFQDKFLPKTIRESIHTMVQMLMIIYRVLMHALVLKDVFLLHNNDNHNQPPYHVTEENGHHNTSTNYDDIDVEAIAVTDEENYHNERGQGLGYIMKTINETVIKNVMIPTTRISFILTTNFTPTTTTVVAVPVAVEI
ncbi:hypothetical protein BDA99DRAFT_533923 [Phascolomyces articulosus]|uniref:Uncharacterized protein n=1 Tax=Phascolomyces articulosus TaxID=60185 RepID=A0AAD5K8D0_9FUNG|nr:hypothetical protein BDA99DRAFT_533923 [Phascolomyces articulosus]